MEIMVGYLRWLLKVTENAINDVGLLRSMTLTIYEATHLFNRPLRNAPIGLDFSKIRSM